MKAKAIYSVIFTALLLGTSAGCGAGQNNAGQASTSPPSAGNGASRAQSVTEKAYQEPLKNDGRISPDYVKVRMKPGMTAQEAEAAFGRNYTPISREAGGGMAKWRYDYADAGYQFQSTAPDKPDIDAIGKGMAHLQLFLIWDPAADKTSSAVLYYKASDHHGDHTVNLYTVSANGEIKEGRAD